MFTSLLYIYYNIKSRFCKRLFRIILFSSATCFEQLEAFVGRQEIVSFAVGEPLEQAFSAHVSQHALNGILDAWIDAFRGARTRQAMRQDPDVVSFWRWVLELASSFPITFAEQPMCRHRILSKLFFHFLNSSMLSMIIIPQGNK